MTLFKSIKKFKRKTYIRKTNPEYLFTKLESTGTRLLIFKSRILIKKNCFNDDNNPDYFLKIFRSMAQPYYAFGARNRHVSGKVLRYRLGEEMAFEQFRSNSGLSRFIFWSIKTKNLMAVQYYKVSGFCMVKKT